VNAPPFTLLLSRLLLGGAILFGPAMGEAAILTVYNGGDAGGTCPGSACTLRQAIATAAPGDTINFGSFVPTVNLTGGELFIDKALTISGGSAARPIIVKRGDFSTNFRIFHIYGNGSVTLSGLTITSGNVSVQSGLVGGGIFNESTGVLTLAGCTISYNLADFDGGGIYNISAGTIIISNSTISRNYTNQNGAGILNLGAVTIANSTIGPENSAANFSLGSRNLGGGIYNSGTLSIRDSTVSGNEASHGIGSTGRGGGIYNTSTGALTLTNTTVSGNTNSPNEGAGIYNDAGGTATARNTIIAANTNFGGAPDFSGALTSQGFNLIGNNSGATIEPLQSTDQVGTAGSPLDPALGPLQDNGGTTQTQALLSQSTAIDRGHASGSHSDQRGFLRPRDDPAFPNGPESDGGDIGAFEVQAPTPTPSPTPSPTPTATPARSLNISTRARVQDGDNVMIGGFIITGQGPKTVLVRALGPSLQRFGLTGCLADPTLELYGQDGSLLGSNDNWRDDPGQALLIEATGIPPSDDHEAAILEEVLLPGPSYTAVVRGKANGTGLSLVEVYDVQEQSSSVSELANISTRAFVETGDGVVIGGFILGGAEGNPRMILRAIGPSLAQLGIANPLADPTLELRDGNGMLVTSNDNWEDDLEQAALIVHAGVPPQNHLEAAMYVTIPPGTYTAIMAGKNGGTGVGLVEIFNMH
jgi:hypothetical protein